MVFLSAKINSFSSVITSFLNLFLFEGSVLTKSFKTEKWHKIFFGGDTGYDEKIFKEVGERLGPFDLSLIPIGAYEPVKYFQCIHVSPEEGQRVSF